VRACVRVRVVVEEPYIAATNSNPLVPITSPPSPPPGSTPGLSSPTKANVLYCLQAAANKHIYDILWTTKHAQILDRNY
jgi:hypothetical protein